MLAGVCGGLGDYLGIDPTLVRLFFILLAWSNGFGVGLYFLLWVILPREGQAGRTTLGDTARSGADEIAQQARAVGDELRQAVQHPHPQASLYIGLALVILGGLSLLDSLHLSWLSWLQPAMIWPVLLIVAGLALIFRRWRGE